MTELSIIPSETALQVFTAPKGLDPYLSQIRSEIDSFVPDARTKKGREAIASIAFKVSKAKAYLESVGKDLADAQKEIPKKIDASRKHMRDTLDAWKEEVRKPLTEWENAEESRVSRIKSAISSYQAFADDRTQRPSNVLRADLITLREQSITEVEYSEYTEAAKLVLAQAVKAVESALVEAEKRESDAAELSELRRLQAEREAKDRDERIAREAADKARLDAEAHAKKLADEAERKSKAEAYAASERERAAEAALKSAETARIAAEQRAIQAEKADKERAELYHKEKLDAEKYEAARREADKSHRASINSSAVDAFVSGGMTEESAKKAVVLIAQRKIPAISILY